VGELYRSTSSFILHHQLHDQAKQETVEYVSGDRGSGYPVSKYLMKFRQIALKFRSSVDLSNIINLKKINKGTQMVQENVEICLIEFTMLFKEMWNFHFKLLPLPLAGTRSDIAVTVIIT